MTDFNAKYSKYCDNMSSRIKIIGIAVAGIILCTGCPSGSFTTRTSIFFEDNSAKRTTTDSSTVVIAIQNGDTLKASSVERQDSIICVGVSAQPGVVIVKLCDTIDCSSPINFTVENEMFNWLEITMGSDEKSSKKISINNYWKGVPASYLVSISEQGSR